MSHNRHLVAMCLIVIWLCPSRAICPSQCACRQDERGRRKVSCTQGGLTVIPVAEMDSGIEVLEISAPLNNTNVLTIGPIFHGFRSLEELHVTRSNVLSIGMHSFWGVPSLKVLNLTVNLIATVQDHNFRGLVNLLELHLDDNRIKNLNSGTFRHLTELRILSMKRNELDDLVPRLFMKLSKLQVLRLNGNALQELNPEAFKDIQEVRVLECRGCSLRRINTQIYHLMPYIEHLDLGNNQFQHLVNDEFVSLRKLKSLNLDGNQLPVILEKTFVNQPELLKLNFARNRLAKVTNTAFLNLTNLTELDLSYNKLYKIEPIAFQPCASTLQVLRLSGNHIHVDNLRVILDVTTRVRDLSVADMNLTEIPSGMFSEKVRILNISGNQLAYLASQVLPAQLVQIDLSRNKLISFDERVVSRLELVPQVFLDQNPWTCDLCHVGHLLVRFNTSEVLKKMLCSVPQRLLGIPLRNLELEDLDTCNGDVTSSLLEEGTLGLIAGCISVLVFVGSSVGVFLCLCYSRRNAPPRREARKRASAAAGTSEDFLQNPTAIFENGEISFKFPLQTKDGKVASISTIDEIKRNTIPNGT